MSTSQFRLNAREYERLREATTTHREELVVRLCGEVGLRAAEISRLRPADIDGGRERSGQFLTVREADGGQRTAYAPDGVAHDLQQYVRSNDIGEDDRVVDVTPRRIQMLVDDVADRAARQSGRTVFAEVTPSTLRQRFGQQLLVDGVDARVVAAVGGWQGIDALLERMDPPTREEIADEFERLSDGAKPRDSRLKRIVTTLDTVDEHLVNALTRAEIDERVCDQLTDIYPAVWIAERSPTRNKVSVRAHAGESPDRFDGAGRTSIIRRVLQSGRTLVAPDDPGPASQQEGRGLLAAAPLSHGETGYGVLVVRAETDDAFDDTERTALTALGRRIAFSITATERKLLLLGDTVLELRFRYDDPFEPLVSISSATGCTLALSGLVPGENRSLVCFVEARETTTTAVLEAATDTDGIADVRLVRRDDDGGLVEVVLADRSPLLALTERGATVTDLHIEAGVASLTCELSPETDVRAVHDELCAQFPSLDLRRKQERQATHETPDVRATIDEHLTDRQRAVLEGAYHAGYFEWPRESTAEDLAESMGVSPPTLHNHLRKAQGKLLDSIY